MGPTGELWDWYYQWSIATQKCFSKTLSIFFMKDCLLIHLADPSLKKIPNVYEINIF